jgi:hypothetical protein
VAVADAGGTARPPARLRRRLIGLGIAAYLAWQIAVPLRYYLAENRRDERFAWRIFSALAIPPYRCDARVREFAGDDQVGREVNLTRTLHDAWIPMLRRGQGEVVERVLRTRCESGSMVAAVDFWRTCRREDRAPAPFRHVRLDCRSGTTLAQEEMR